LRGPGSPLGRQSSRVERPDDIATLDGRRTLRIGFGDITRRSRGVEAGVAHVSACRARHRHRTAAERYRYALWRNPEHLTDRQHEQLAWIAKTDPRVSQIERGEVSTLDSIVRYVEALGGRLDVVANFDDHTLTVTTTDAA
jgi:hypothetical protein